MTSRMLNTDPLDPDALAQAMVNQGRVASLDEAYALIYAQRPDLLGQAAPQAAPQVARRNLDGSTPIASLVGQRQQAAPRQAPPPSAPPQRGQDQYGDSPIANSNAAGVQSNGDDNPWLIGAFEGGTYDPSVMKMWAQRADAGDPKAAWVLTQVGFQPGMTLDQWASSRKLDVHADEMGGAPSPWTHDPRNAPRQLGLGASDSRSSLYDTARYQNESDALSNYGWWNNQDPEAFVQGRQGRAAAPEPEPAPEPAPAPKQGQTLYDQPYPDPINQAKADKGPPPVTPSGLDPNYAAGKPDTIPDVPLESAPLKLDDSGRKLLGWYR